MMGVRRLPRNDKTCGWNAILEDRTSTSELSGTYHYDWLIIGGGYAGLAAARNLAIKNPKLSIAILEACEVGENASGKNSGFAIDLPHYSENALLPQEVASKEIELYRYAIEKLDSTIHEHNIECDWQKKGRYHAAVTKEVGDQILDKYRKNLEHWGEEHIYLNRDSLEKELGSKYYYSAIYTPGTYLLNPAALVRGLADSLPENVTLFENSPVLGFDFKSKEKFVVTSNGKIIFGKVIVAVNSFLQEFGLYKNRQVPIVLYASLTKPLETTEVNKMGENQNWGITPAHGTTGSTLRFTSDDRLLMRHGFKYSPNLSEVITNLNFAKIKHTQLLKDRFPQIKFDVEHTWMGWLSISNNHAPIFGKACEDVYVAACCNGAGIARHTAAGYLISDLAMGEDNQFIHTYISNGLASYLPPRPFLDIGIKFRTCIDIYKGKCEE